MPFKFVRNENNVTKKITYPEGASDQQILSYANKKFGGNFEIANPSILGGIRAVDRGIQSGFLSTLLTGAQGPAAFVEEVASRSWKENFADAASAAIGSFKIQPVLDEKGEHIPKEQRDKTQEKENRDRSESILESIGGTRTPESVVNSQKFFSQGIRDLKSFVQSDLLAVDPEYQDHWSYKFGNALGSLSSFGVVSYVTRGRGPKAELVMPAFAVSTGMGEQAERIARAREQGIPVDNAEALQALSLAGGVGLTELAPVERLFKGLPKNLPSGFKNQIIARLKNALATGGVEGVQEVAATLMQDAIERGIYNENLSLLNESLADDFTYGALAGFTADLVLNAISGRRNSFSTQEDLDYEADLRREEDAQAKRYVDSLTTPPTVAPIQEVDPSQIQAPTQQELASSGITIDGRRGPVERVQFGALYASRIADSLGDNFPSGIGFRVVEDLDQDGMDVSYRVVDESGKQYGQRLVSKRQANALSGNLNKVSVDRAVAKAAREVVGADANAYGPDKAEQAFRLAYRALHPEYNTFGTLAVNQAAGTTVENGYREELNYKTILGGKEIKRGDKIVGYEITAPNGKKSVVKGLTAAQKINKAREEQGLPQTRRFSKEEVVSALGKKANNLVGALRPNQSWRPVSRRDGTYGVVSQSGEFISRRPLTPAEIAALPTKPEGGVSKVTPMTLGRRRARGFVRGTEGGGPIAYGDNMIRIGSMQEARAFADKLNSGSAPSLSVREVIGDSPSAYVKALKNLLAAKNISSKTNSPEMSSLFKLITGKNYLAKMNDFERGLVYERIRALPRFESPSQIPNLNPRSFSPVQLSRASRFIKESENKGVSYGALDVAQAAGVAPSNSDVSKIGQDLINEYKSQSAKAAPLLLPSPKSFGPNPIESLSKALKSVLRGYGFGDLKLSLGQTLVDPSGRVLGDETQAGYERYTKTLLFAIDRIDPDGSLTLEQQEQALAELLNHEIVHAARALDLWTEQEWSLLEKAVSKLKPIGSNKTYLENASNLYPDQSPVVQIEEAVAELIRNHIKNNKSVSGKPKSLVKRFVSFMQRLSSAIRGTGFNNYEDVINLLESGQLGARERGVVRTARLTEETLAKQNILPERLRPVLSAIRPEAAPPEPAVSRAPASDFGIPLDREFTESLEREEPVEGVLRRSVKTKDVFVNGVRESIAVIDVDGVDRPVNNALKRRIHPTVEGIKNFWKWFGNSPAVDEAGRPIVYYHGTARDIFEFLQKQASAIFGSPDPDFSTPYSTSSLNWVFTNFTEIFSPEQSSQSFDLAKKRIEYFGQTSLNNFKEAVSEIKEIINIAAGRAASENVLSRQNLVDLELLRWRLAQRAQRVDLSEEQQGVDQLIRLLDSAVAFNEDKFNTTNDVLDYYYNNFVQEYNNANSLLAENKRIPEKERTQEDQQTRLFVEKRINSIISDIYKNFRILSIPLSDYDPSFSANSPFGQAVGKALGNEILFVAEDFGVENQVTDVLRKFGESRASLLSLSQYENPDGTIREPNKEDRYWYDRVPGTFISDALKHSVLQVYGTGPSIMPLYLAPKNPFDFDNRSHVDAVFDELAKIGVLPGSTEELQIRRQILGGVWGTIESYDVQEAIGVAGFDGFYVQEFGRKNLAVYKNTDVKSLLNDGQWSSVQPNILESRRVPRPDVAGVTRTTVDSDQRILQTRGAPPSPSAITSIGLLDGTERFERVASGSYVARFLQNRAIQNLGGPLNISEDSAREFVAEAIAAEAIAEMARKKEALDWYDATVEIMLERLAIRFPEILTDNNARTALLLSVAITSQNMSVPENLRAGIEIYSGWKRTGRFPEKGFGAKSPAIKKNFEKANAMIDYLNGNGNGMADLAFLLEEKFTVRELNTILSKIAPGTKVGGENLNTVVYGSAAFGPKIGQGFYSNLRGEFSPVTMDMWFMRMIGRLTGTLTNYNQQVLERQLTELADAAGIPLPNGLNESEISRLIAASESILSQHERDFKNFRAEYDAGTRQKSLAVRISERIKKNLKGTNNAPKSGGERNLLRDIVERTRSKVKDYTGIDIPAASLQALVWYPEQRLWKKLGARLRFTETDYAESSKSFLLEQGVSEAELDAAESRVRKRRERGTGSIRPADGELVGGAIEGVRAGAGEALLREARRSPVSKDLERDALDKAKRIAEETPPGNVPLYNLNASPFALAIAQNPFLAGDGRVEISPDNGGISNGIRPERAGDREQRAAAARIAFEVAPDPNDEALTARWRQLTQPQRLEISERVARAIVPKVLKFLKSKGDVLAQVGSYLEDTNPSFALRVDKGDVDQLAKFLGFVLSQDSMMVIAPAEFPGSFKAQALRLEVGEKTPSEVDQIYQTLRAITLPDGRQPIGGQSASGGVMTVLLDSQDDAATIGLLVDEALAGAYNIGVADVFAAFPEKQDYDYARVQDDPAGDEGLVRQRARDARAQAAELLRKELDAAETGPAADADKKANLRFSRNRPPQVTPREKDVIDRLTGSPVVRTTPGQAYIAATGLGNVAAQLNMLRAQAVNRYAAIEYYERTDPNLSRNLADTSALAALEFRDRYKGIFASAIADGVVSYVPVTDKQGNVTGNLTKVVDFYHNGKKVDGLIGVMKPLFENDYGVNLENLAQSYAISLRAERLAREGKKTPAQAGDLAVIKAASDKYINSETGRPIIEEWYETWQAYNEKIIDFLERTGVIDAEGATLWRDQADYVPFYRELAAGTNNEPIVKSPKIFGGMTSAAGFTRLKGGETGVNVPLLDSILRNYEAAISMGMSNVAQQRVVRDMLTIGMAEMVPFKSNTVGQDVVSFKVGGKKVRAYIKDPLVYQSLQNLDPGFLDSAVFNILLKKPADIVREMITREPAYMLSNTMRDTISAWQNTGANILPIVSTVVGLSSNPVQFLSRYGIVNGYDFGADPTDAVNYFSKEAFKQGVSIPSEKRALSDKITQSVPMKPIMLLWDALGNMSQRAEAASRKAVYDAVLKETGNEAEAAYQALRVINYSRRGNSKTLRAITAAVPFMNARIQGLDVIYQAASGRFGARRSVLTKGQIASAFLIRGAILTGLSMYYYLLASDSEEYKEATEEDRDNYYIIPVVKGDKEKGVKGYAVYIPKPFENGLIFSTIPERIMAGIDGLYTQKEQRDFGLRALGNTLAMNPIPQAVKPILEATQNRSFFTGRPIVPVFEEMNKLPYLQSRPTTNEAARLVARQMAELGVANISPMKIEHVARGYFGTLGTYLLNAVDSTTRAYTGSELPSRRIVDYPVVRRFVRQSGDSGLENQFYALRANVDQVVGSLKSLQEQGRMDEYNAMLRSNSGLISTKKWVQRTEAKLSKLRAQKNFIMTNQNFDPEKRREIVEQIDNQMRMVVSDMEIVRRMAYSIKPSQTIEGMRQAVR